MQSHHVNLPVARIRYLEEGAEHPGTPVVLLHGGGLDSALLSWKHTLPALGRLRRVLALDWPGYGESTGPDGDYRLSALIDVLHEFLEALELPRVHLVGISMGGGVAIGYTLAHPQRVDRVVLVDSYGLQTRAPVHELSFIVVHLPGLSRSLYAVMRRSRAVTRAALRPIFADPEHITDDIVDEVYEVVRRPGAERPYGVFQRHEIRGRRLRTNYLSRLGEISQPTLYVHGDKDTLVPLAASQQGARLTPHGKLHVIDRCGHWPPRERSEEFNGVVATFLIG
jgi:pimeloyl-ACP methyl ester carboxylesterase